MKFTRIFSVFSLTLLTLLISAVDYAHSDECPVSLAISIEASGSGCAGVCGLAGGVLAPGFVLLSNIPFSSAQGALAEGLQKEASAKADSACNQDLAKQTSERTKICNAYCATSKCYSELMPVPAGHIACSSASLCVSSGVSAVIPLPDGGTTTGKVEVGRVTCDSKGKAAYLCKCGRTIEELLSSSLSPEQEWEDLILGY